MRLKTEALFKPIDRSEQSEVIVATIEIDELLGESSFGHLTMAGEQTS
jgi:hypothetical protein